MTRKESTPILKYAGAETNPGTHRSKNFEGLRPIHTVVFLDPPSVRAPAQAREDTSPEKTNMTSKYPVGDISVVTLLVRDATLNRSQKAEQVAGRGKA